MEGHLTTGGDIPRVGPLVHHRASWLGIFVPVISTPSHQSLPGHPKGRKNQACVQGW